jgi:hypothetical protein
VRNHYPVDASWTLLEGSKSETQHSNRENQPTLNEFLNGPLIYSSAYHHTLTDLHPATFDVHAKKNEAINFRFASDNINQVELSIHRYDQVASYQPEFVKNPDGLYTLNHTFTKKGRHIVHVLLNNSYAFTYAITVQ